METLTRIYIFFIGIIALLVCFITWVAIRLRAERINRIRENKASQTRYDELNTLLNEAVNKVGGLKYSNDSLNTLIEGNKVLLDSHEAKIAHLNNVINEKHEYIEKLQGQIQNLINCISRTGIRDVKGVVRKCNLGEIQSVISGNHLILKPKPFKKYRSKLKVKLPIRSVTSLKMGEGIIVNNKEEEIKALELYEEVGFVWIYSLGKPTSVVSDLPYPHAIIHSSFGGRISNTLGIDGKFSLSDFIQPKPTRDWSVPEKLGMSIPLDHPEHPQFKKK